MNNRDKTALSLALAIVGGIAADPFDAVAHGETAEAERIRAQLVKMVEAI